MKKNKILVIDSYTKEFFEQLAEYGAIIEAKDLDDHIQLDDVNILVVRSKTKVDKKLVDRMRNLACVITATHGMDHICVDYLKEKKIQCYNAPVQSYDIAQGVIAYILAHSTRLLEGDRSMKRGIWQKNKLTGFRIQGKTLGIIGFGKIGKEVARLATALEMKIVTYDPYIKETESNATLDDLLRVSDFITIHVPLTEETRGLIGKNEISKMKDGAYLMNTARGGIIDEMALLNAIKQGKLGGAALDVWEHQPPFENEVSNRLAKDEKVTATPHSIGQSLEAVEEKGKRVIDIIKSLHLEKSSYP
jgi:phosphoglycerate dehydrogenase-like enzyme